MRLAQPFYQLPILLDGARLQEEVLNLAPEAWVPHPDGLPGNSAVRLISADGKATDSVHGQMLATRWLEAMPYVKQVLTAFGVVWGRSRLMRLAPGATVPEHADINYHWHTRIRVHVPIFSRPEVRFHCDGQAVHMGVGQAWIFDNWRRHHVVNPTPVERIHLVADTSGTAAFWQFACGKTPPRDEWRTLHWDPSHKGELLTEYNQRTTIMSAAEAQLLIEDICDELTSMQQSNGAQERATRFRLVMEGFLFDWRQLCALHGLNGRAQPEFERLIAKVRAVVGPLAHDLVMPSNSVSALKVLEQRVLQHLIVT